jgi:hypothetical protein
MIFLFLFILDSLLISSDWKADLNDTLKVCNRTYTTSFDLSENPISDNGNWTNGRTTGIDWSDVSSLDGVAIGHQKGDVRYLDATALLTGIWCPDQAAQATVYVTRTYESDYPEVELRLRSTLSAHHCAGYEIAFSTAGKTSNAYLLIVRWNGPVGDFTYLKELRGAQYGAGNGDVIKATINGSTITALINGVLVAQAVDTVYTSGTPGIGFNFDWVDHRIARGTNMGYGFTDFTATDRMTNQVQKVR